MFFVFKTCKTSPAVVSLDHNFMGDNDMCIKFCKNESECKCDNYNEFEIKLSCMKTKLHSRYIGAIAFGIVIWSLATGEANNAEFASWISFASTITSIILSVIAIFMSISGENKTDAMRDKMEDASKKLEGTAKEIEDANKKSIESMQLLKREIDELKMVLKNIPSETVEKIQTEYEVNKVEREVSKNSSKGWVNKNEK